MIRDLIFSLSYLIGAISLVLAILGFLLHCDAAATIFSLVFLVCGLVARWVLKQ